MQATLERSLLAERERPTTRLTLSAPQVSSSPSRRLAWAPRCTRPWRMPSCCKTMISRERRTTFTYVSTRQLAQTSHTKPTHKTHDRTMVGSDLDTLWICGAVWVVVLVWLVAILLQIHWRLQGSTKNCCCCCCAYNEAQLRFDGNQVGVRDSYAAVVDASVVRLAALAALAALAVVSGAARVASQ